MLQAFGLSFTPDPRGGPLFSNIDLSVGPAEHVALVGRNGAGKSILMRMLTGEIRPPTGRVVLTGGARIAYLPQDFELGFEGTLADLLEKLAPQAPQHLIARAMHRVDLAPAMLKRQYSGLSLGERMKGGIAALLASEPTILLLDEPTNHLDVAAKDWLERYLRECPEAVLFACHDRTVINAVADRVLEMDRGSLNAYAGGFDDMVEFKRQRDERLQAEWERHKHEDRRLRVAAESAFQNAAKVTKKPTQRTYDPKQKAFFAGKQAKMDQRARAILSRVTKGREDAPDKPFVEIGPALEFPASPLRSSQVLAARGLTKSYGSRVLFANLNLTLEKGSRVAVLGPNGSGKTTLFRILLGEEQPDSGEASWSSDARIATLSQARDALEMDVPIIRALDPPDNASAQFARSALGRLGIRGDMLERELAVLSVGERTKVEVVAMILTGANVLVLDEPTNHLDLPSVEALEGALSEFPGAILFTSHDRSFVDRLATEKVEL